MKAIINIELAFLDDLTKSTLTYFLQSSLCKSARLSKSPAETDLYIVDHSKIGDDQYTKSILDDNKFIIILLNKNHCLEPKKNCWLLKKPINTFELIELIDQLQQKINNQNKITSKSKPAPTDTIIEKSIPIDVPHNHLYNAVNEENRNDIHQRYRAQKFVGSNKDFSDIESIPVNIFITKSSYFYHFLAQAMKLGKANNNSTLLKLRKGNFLYDHNKKTFQHNFEPRNLKYLQTAPLSREINIEYINDKIIPNFTGQHQINQTEFIWESAIQASRGRIPHGTKLDQPVKLTRWPNFSQLQIFRYAIQITAVWSKHKLSLFDTAKQLRIPQRYVFTLYCAMHALGYATIEDSNSKNTYTKPKNNNSSLFSRIINHIFN